MQKVDSNCSARVVADSDIKMRICSSASIAENHYVSGIDCRFKRRPTKSLIAFLFSDYDWCLLIKNAFPNTIYFRINGCNKNFII